MPANLSYHQPIGSVMQQNNATPLTGALPEKAGQVFKYGVPVQSSNGYAQQWDGVTVAGAIVGFSLGVGSNLPTNGAGAPYGFNQIGPPGAIATYGTVPNQPSAVNIAVGTPITDGRVLFEAAVSGTIFEAQFDNSNGGNAASYQPTIAMIGQQFGLTADASGQFYVDANKTTAGTNTVVQVVGINPIDMQNSTTGNVNARVFFQVLNTARQDYI